MTTNINPIEAVAAALKLNLTDFITETLCITTTRDEVRILIDDHADGRHLHTLGDWATHLAAPHITTDHSEIGGGPGDNVAIHLSGYISGAAVTITARHYGDLYRRVALLLAEPITLESLVHIADVLHAEHHGIQRPDGNAADLDEPHAIELPADATQPVATANIKKVAA